MPEPGPPGPGGPAGALLENEQAINRRTRELMGRCRSCRRTLEGMDARSRRRLRALETERFQDTGKAPPPLPPGPRRPRGVLAELRELAGALERQGQAYGRAAREQPGRAGQYQEFQKQCLRDAGAVRGLIGESMGR